MPFTISHAVAVIPLARNRRLVPAALVIGSWVPDLPYFVPLLGSSGWTHAASGPVTIDLLLGLAVLGLWRLVLRRPLVDLAPGPLRRRVPPATRLDGGHLLGALVSVVLGAVTHVVWDTFTHAGRWGTTHVPALTAALGPLPAYTWLQLASGALGLAGLLVWAVLWFRRTPPRPVPPQARRSFRTSVWIGVPAVAVLVAAAVLALGQDLSLEAAAFAAVTASMGSAGAAVFLVSIAWLVLHHAPLAGAGPSKGDETLPELEGRPDAP